MTIDEPLHPAILASDAEREQSVALLSQAAVEGRLTLDEFSDRVGLAQSARTREDLATLARDLPAARVPAVAPEPVRHRVLCSRLVRRGPWSLSERSSYRCLFGTIDLDLAEVRLGGPEIELDVYNLFGTVTVHVPEGVDVSVEGGGAFASQVVDAPRSLPAAGAPRLRINIGGPGGTLYVLRGSSDRRDARGRLESGAKHEDGGAR